MKKWKGVNLATAALVILTLGCNGMFDSVFQPKPLDGMKAIAASEETKKLDQEVTGFLRGRYAIEKAKYYRAPASMAWIAISKNVQNQMAAKSIKPIMFEWYEPGIDFVEIYPQGEKGAGFALAAPRDMQFEGEKLLAFYVLSSAGGKK